MKRVVIHIDRLVLTGVRHADRHTVARSLREQLAAILSAPVGAHHLTQIGNIARLHVKPATVAAGAAPRQLGSAAAKSIGEGLKR